MPSPVACSVRSSPSTFTLTVASGTESLDQVLYALVEMTSNEIGCDRSTFFLYDPDTNDLFSRIAQGLRSREIRISANEGIAGAVYRSGEPIVLGATFPYVVLYSGVPRGASARQWVIIRIAPGRSGSPLLV